MPEHDIKIKLDLTEANRQLGELKNKLNSLGDSSAAAGGAAVGIAAGGASGGALGVAIGAITIAFGKLKEMMGAVKDFIVGTVKGAFSALKNTIIGTAAAVYGLHKSIGILIPGLTKMVQMQAAQPWMKLARQINTATAGIIDLNTAISIAQRNGGMLGDKDVVIIAEYLTMLKATRSNALDLFDVNQKMVKGIEKGMLDEEQRKQIGGKVVDQLNKALSIQDMSVRKQEFMNVITREHNKLRKQTGDILKSNTSLMLGAMKALNDESTGTLDIIKGFGAAAASLFGPLAGGLASFKSGAISGVLGTSLGLLSSGVMTATVVRVLGMFSSGLDEEGGSVQKQMTSMMDSLFAVIRAGLSAFEGELLGVGTIIGKEVGSMTNEQIRVLQKDKETLNQTRTRLAGYVEKFRQVGQGLVSFSSSFFDTIDIDGWIKRLKDLFGVGKGEKLDLNVIGERLGKWLGETMNSIVNSFIKIAKWIKEGGIGETAESIKKTLEDTLIGQVLMFFKNLLTFMNDLGITFKNIKKVSTTLFNLTAIGATINSITQVLKWINEAFELWNDLKIFRVEPKEPKEEHGSLGITNQTYEMAAAEPPSLPTYVTENVQTKLSDAEVEKIRLARTMYLERSELVSVSRENGKKLDQLLIAYQRGQQP